MVLQEIIGNGKAFAYRATIWGVVGWSLFITTLALGKSYDGSENTLAFRLALCVCLWISVMVGVRLFQAGRQWRSLRWHHVLLSLIGASYFVCSFLFYGHALRVLYGTWPG